MQRTKWLDRKFNFDFPAGLLPNIIARLSGTLSRLNQIVLQLSDDQLKQKQDDKWSIKEQIGHLSETDSLHEGRIDDILLHKEVLRPAGTRKYEITKVDYNQEDIGKLLLRFDVGRQRLLNLLEGLDDESQNTASLHPRLQVMMRPVDIAYFAAEHDDHHIASIQESLKTLE